MSSTSTKHHVSVALASLVFDENLRLRISPRALPKFEIKRDDGELLVEDDEDVRLTLERFVRRCRVDVLRLAANFVSNVGLYLPPTGYVATYHGDTTFDPHPYRHLFRGFAYCSLNMKRTHRIKDSEVARYTSAVNALVRDASPIPFSSRGKCWTCSLGSYAWIALCRKRVDADVDSDLAAYVVAGLDDATYDEMERMFKLLSKNNVTTRQSFEETLAPYREAARRNRARLLATFAEALGTKTKKSDRVKDEEYETDDDVDDAVSSDVDVEARAREWFERAVGEGVDVPGWYRVPGRTPQGCPPVDDDVAGFRLGATSTNKNPVEAVPDLDVCFDDVVPWEDDHVVRVDGCVAFDASRLPRIRSPTEDVKIYSRTVPYERYERPFPVAASQSPPSSYDDPEPECAVAWEDPDLPICRLLTSRYRSDDRASDYPYVDAKKDYVVLEPLFVRASCVDAYGFAKRRHDAEAKRFRNVPFRDWNPIR